MKNFNFIRSVSSWGYWISAIGKVMTGIVAVFSLLGVVLLISLPKNFVQVEVLSTVKIDMNFKDLLGEDWENHKESIAATIGPDVEITENGASLTEEETNSVLEMRAAALYLIPAFVEYSMLSATLYFASKVFRELKDSPVPFTPEAAKHIRTAGTITMVLGAAPGLASGLIGLLTSAAMDSVDMDLGLVFTGFVLWALSEIFQYGLSLQCGSETPPSTDNHTDPNAF